MLKNYLPNNNYAKLSILFGVGSSVLFYITLKQYLRIRKYKHIPGPKRKGIFGFFTGNYHEIVENDSNGITFSGSLLNWATEYGTIYKFQVFDQFCVTISDPDSIKKLLIENDSKKYEHSYKLLGFPYQERTVGNGLVTEIDKDAWKAKRALFNHGFQKNVLMDSVKDFDEKCNILMEKFRSLADGNTFISMFNDINRLTLDVIASVAFGINNDSVSNSQNELNSLIGKLLAGINDLLVDPLIEFKPSKSHNVKEFKKAARTIRNYCRDHILQRFKLMENKEYVPNDILSIIIKNYESEQIEIESLVDEFLTFFIAGQETTANSLAFCILELGQNPECLEKAREEVDRVIGKKSQITHDDLAQMEYLSCVFKESLRKWPPVPSFSRETEIDLELHGYKVPKGTWVELSIYACGRNPNFFSEPEKFLPERFLKDSNIAKQNKINSYTYFPFSLGPRNCIGQNFAKIEAKLFLAKFIQNFDFKLDPNQSLKVKENLTLRPADGCRASLTIRAN